MPQAKGILFGIAMAVVCAIMFGLLFDNTLVGIFTSIGIGVGVALAIGGDRWSGRDEGPGD